MDKILIGHGSGGRMMHELITGHFAPEFGMEGHGDSAILDMPQGAKLALTTDSYVVSPLFFPGGNIGDLAVNGTINDLSVAGARPVYLTAGFIIEEGFLFEDLQRIISSMAAAARRADVKIVAGDTKVVEKGKGDGIFISTSGVGVVPAGRQLSPAAIKPGDRLLVSGSLGNHGIVVMALRNGLSFDPPLRSDTAPLCNLTEAILNDADGVRAMRDPTRGGLATVLKEFALESGLCLVLDESQVPVSPGVRGACELLGLDPLYVANEGVLLAVVRPDMAEYVLEKMRQHPAGSEASIIGEVRAEPGKTVLGKTETGGKRVVEMLSGEQLPRIC